MKMKLSLFITILSVFFSLNIKANQVYEYYPNSYYYDQKDDNPDDLILTLENLYKRILKSGIEFPDIAFAQAILESGYFKSKISKSNSNIFGMKMPKKRPTTAKGEKRGFSFYETWHDSVDDYKLYQERILKRGNITRTEYLEKLNRNYSSNSSYSIKIKAIIKKHKDIIGEIPSDRTDGKF